jgi:hypothetical protein
MRLSELEGEALQQKGGMPKLAANGRQGVTRCSGLARLGGIIDFLPQVTIEQPFDFLIDFYRLYEL